MPQPQQDQPPPLLTLPFAAGWIPRAAFRELRADSTNELIVMETQLPTGSATDIAQPWEEGRTIITKTQGKDQAQRPCSALFCATQVEQDFKKSDSVPDSAVLLISLFGVSWGCSVSAIPSAGWPGLGMEDSLSPAHDLNWKDSFKNEDGVSY